MIGARLPKIFLGLAALITVLMSACVQGPTRAMDPVRYPDELRDARGMMKNGNLAGAERQIQDYLHKTTDVNWYGPGFLLLGECREEAGKSAEAEEAYKQAVAHGAGYDGQVLVQSLYKMSWLYEKAGRYADELVALNDLEKNLNTADGFLKNVETPSRLANVYLAEGMWKQANEQRQRVSARLLTETLAQIDGKVLNLSHDDFYRAELYRAFGVLEPGKVPEISATTILPLVQKDLLDIGEMAPATIAKQALLKLHGFYKQRWAAIKDVKKQKNRTEALSANRTRLEFLAQFMDQIQDLKSSRRPLEVVANPEMNKDFFNKLSVIETEVRRQAEMLELGVQKAEGVDYKGKKNKGIK